MRNDFEVIFQKLLKRPDLIVDILAGGAVCLGSQVACDGFVYDHPVRVQTHIHDDHMNEFNRSKGMHDILMSPETHALLVAEYNADIEYRSNLHRVTRGEVHNLKDGSKLTLLPSNHMLGACQVALELPDGLRIGYSGDFGWPVDEIIKVDQLVVDSTYGSSDSIRRYTQAEAEECLLTLVSGRLRHGSVHICAHRGTIERVLHVLGGNVNVPILATDRLIKEVTVYQNHGFAIGNLTEIDSDTGRIAVKERSYIRLYSKGDGFRNEPINPTSIVCSAYMVNSDSPLLTYSDKSYRVALSNHADFEETLAYIEATGAKQVVTDNTRNHGCDLAIEINNRLPGVRAEPSSNKPGPRWN